jgi:hypothetical protein
MADITNILKEALAQDQRGDWDGAHTAVQSLEDPRAYWIHAYLHRKEGDLGNARYWYDRAGRSMPSGPLEEEWQTLLVALGGAE